MRTTAKLTIAKDAHLTDYNLFVYNGITFLIRLIESLSEDICMESA